MQSRREPTLYGQKIFFDFSILSAAKARLADATAKAKAQR
jgi:hypothetical protein